MKNIDEKSQNSIEAPITKRESRLLRFCEQYAEVEFTGDIEDRIQVRRFIRRFYNSAEDNYNALRAEYEAYQWERFWS